MIKSITRTSSLLLLLLFTLNSCKEDLAFPSFDSDTPVRFSINLHTNASSVVATRTTAPSTGEQVITSAVVMVFSSDAPDATLKQEPVEGTVAQGNKLTVTLTPDKDASNILVLANPTTANKAYLLACTTGTTLSTISAYLTLSVTNSGITPPLPMTGWTGTLSQISKTSMLSATASMVRSVARIDVDGTTGDFIIHGVQLTNGAESGFMLPQTVLPSFDETATITYDMINASTPSATFTEKLYCYENNGMIGNKSNTTRIVVKGQRQGASSPSYYAIDILYTVGQDKRYDIERNKIYTVHFKKVAKDGYSTYAEAARSEAFNTIVDADITVTDPYAYNIVTNGKQYMGTTNSEFVFYPQNNTSDYSISGQVAATLSYTCDPAWMTGTLTPPSGITLMTNTLEVGKGGTPLYKDIIFKSIASDFTEGVIVAHIGNLRQEIKVRVKSPTLPTGLILSDYFDSSVNTLTQYKVGEIIAPSPDTEWLKVANYADDRGGSSLNDKLVHPEGGIYVHVQPNIGYAGAVASRDGSLFVAGEKQHQRIRIYVQQEGYDVYTGKKQIKPFTYVASYHRWNETAERLIRIDASKAIGAGTPWWRATVVAGREFIVLSTEASTDPSIDESQHLGQSEGSYNTAELVEANGQFSSTLRSVEGNTSFVYFKIGMTGRLSGPHAQPRYGLITVAYGSGSSTSIHNIYVRQGEEADYVMRPWDPATGNEFISSIRPKAVKVATYNLTAPNPKFGTDIADEDTRGYVFNDYPSKGSYYFAASGTKALGPTSTYLEGWASHVASVDLAFTIDKPWKKEWETCPRGYRRPNDGVGRSAINPPQQRSDIENSEVRQSLWLFPLQGIQRSDYSNQLSGYIADGYFDRRHIQEIGTTIPQVPTDSIQYGIVKKDAIDAAYWGYLIFNPYNYASIFIPLEGSYHAPDKTIGNKGSQSSFVTSTPGGTNNDSWIVAAGYFNDTKPGGGQPYFVFDNYKTPQQGSSYSVRCIKDIEPPALSDDTQVKEPETGGTTQLMNINYVTSSASLQTVIEAAAATTSDAYKRTNTLAINAEKELTAADYTYLNAWASNTVYSLRHLILRGKGSVSIPAGAFTSSAWATISLVDTHTLKAGAFANTVTGLKNLSFAYLDDITVEAGAFASGFVSTTTQLFLNGSEYDALFHPTTSWKTLTWKAIKQY